MEQFKQHIKLWGAAVLTFLSPVYAAMSAALLLLSFNLVGQLLVAFQKGEHRKKALLKGAVVKAVAYVVLLAVSHLVGERLTGPQVPALQLASTYIGLAELTITLEVIRDLTGLDVFNTILKHLSTKKPE